MAWLEQFCFSNCFKKKNRNNKKNTQKQKALLFENKNNKLTSIVSVIKMCLHRSKLLNFGKNKKYKLGKTSDINQH